MLEGTETIKTENFEVKKLGDGTRVFECAPHLQIGKIRTNYTQLCKVLRSSKTPFSDIFDELGLSDHASVIIDSLEVLGMMGSMFKLLKSLKFTPNLMPIYCFYNPSLGTEEEKKKLAKFVDVHVRLESSTTEDQTVKDLFYVGIRKSQVRYEEKKILCQTIYQPGKVPIFKILDAEKEGLPAAAPAEEAKKPESTFNMGTRNAAESEARANVELPYFIGEKEALVDKSKLFEVDLADREEAIREEMEDMELEGDEEDY